MSRIEELEKRLAADPNSRMFVQLAEEYRKAGLLEQAIEVCEQGIQKHPQYPSARVALGRALLEAESFDRASEQFEAVLKTVPDNILANRFLGETYHRLGRLDEAVKKYQVAQTLAPEDLEIGDRIAAVQKELAAGPPAPAVAAAPAAPAAPPAAAAPSPPPAEAPPKAPPPPPAPTPSASQAREAPPAPPPAVDQDVESIESMGEAPNAALEDDLPPIPLVDVDEPMVLEDRFAAPTPTTPPSEAPAGVDVDMDMNAEAAASYVEPEPFLDTESYVESTLEPEPEPEPEPELVPFAPPPPAPAADSAAPSAPTQADLETKTMAELYASQGHVDQAIEVYEKLVARRPEEPTYRTRLDELKMLEQATRQAQDPAPASPEFPTPAPSSAPPAPEGDDKTIEALSGWLEAIKKSKES